MEKNWKLMERGVNGDNYYIMAAASNDEEFTSRLQDGDRLYVVDQGKTLVWFDGDTFEDTDGSEEPAAASSSSSDSGSDHENEPATDDPSPLPGDETHPENPSVN